MSDSYLLDANILLRRSDAPSQHHAVVRQALNVLSQDNARLCIVAQSLFEFWAVATRPLQNNGLGLTPTEANAFVESHKATFELLPELPLVDEWQRLVTIYGVSGKPTHDARYVAALKVHNLENILTFNGRDFARFADGENIHVVEPTNV